MMHLKSNVNSSPWLWNRTFDSIFLLSPPIVATLFISVLPRQVLELSNLPLWVWVVFILGIDVTHVYSTVFRTYLHRDEFHQHRRLYLLVPTILFIVGVLLYSVEELLFWRALAYAAVFHFMRQQYGFLRLYARKETYSKWSKLVDQLALYSATLYPILYWHTHLPRRFNWFVEGDFISGLPSLVSEIGFYLYIVFQVIYIGLELDRVRKDKCFNWPKNILMFGTVVSWYVSIIKFNGDVAFSIINVVSHGIPYIALIWFYGYQQQRQSDSLLIFDRWNFGTVFKPSHILVFVSILLAFAYVEEGFWDAWVWREHSSVFGPFTLLGAIENRELLSWIVPLLTLPQATHYVLDGFIWKVRDKDSHWQSVLLSK